MPSAFPGGSTLTEATLHPGTMPSTALASPAAAGELAAAAATRGSPGKKAPVVEASNVTVAVRVRPLTEQEKLRMKDLKQPYMAVDGGRQITVRDAADEAKPFAFDHCFDARDAQDAGAAQEEVFEAIGKKVLTHAWEGFNASVFAYGQTGSGKTYTMMGGDGSPEEAGLVPRICQQLFQAIEEAKAQNRRKNVSTRMSYGGYRSGEDEDDGGSSRRSSSGSSSAGVSDVVAAPATGQDTVEFGLKVQYLEIYNERILDLLSKHPDKQLQDRRVPGSAFVEGATTREVSDWAGMQAVLKLGEENRKVAATRANVQSSRSHAIFFLEFTQVSSKRSLLPKSKGTGGQEGDVAVARKSTICLVDLAGSERVNKTGATGHQLKEAQSINLSLMTLGRVITQLAMGGQGVPPYRESKLTLLCKDFLGRNAKTFVLATVSPSVSERGETLGTLGYANQAKNIVTKAQVNEDPKDAYIRSLEGRLAELEASNKLLLNSHNSKASHGPYAFPGDEAGAHSHGHSSHAHHSSISGTHGGLGKAHPVLKVDGKEASDPAAAGNGPAAAGNGPAAAGGPLSPAGSAADYSVVTAESTDESAAHDPVVTSNSSVASAISSSASSAMGHRRMHSKSSERSLAPPSAGSGAGASSAAGSSSTTTTSASTASPGHARTPSQVSRLPRLANTTTLAAGAVAAPALHTPLSPAFLPSPQLAAAGASGKDATPTAAAAATANTATPTTPSVPVVSHNLAAALGQEAASASSKAPSRYATFSSSAAERMTVEEALALKARFLKAEQEVGTQARGELGQQQLVNQLTARVLAALPLVLEANALAQAANKPVAFYLDVLPRALPAHEKAARVTETLKHLGQAFLVEAMGLPSRNNANAAAAPAPLLPALLEAAEEAPTVVVRAVGALSDGVAELSVDAFKEALQAMKAARPRPGGPMPLIQGYESTADTGLAGLAAGADGKTDPFYFAGQDSTLARSDVYLSALLGNRNVLGAFPLLRGLDGACVGAVKLKLVPQAELQPSPVGMEGGYSLALELEELVVDKAPLGQLALGGAWNAAQDSYQPAVLRYPDEGVPGLVLRYGFWPCNAPCGEVELSAGASAVREMAARGVGGGGVGAEQVRFPMSHKAALNVPSVGPEFLAYLATGALRLTLHLSKDPAEDALWTRHHGIPQLPTERCWALSRVQSVDPPEAASLAAPTGAAASSVYGMPTSMHEEEDDEVHAALGGLRTHRRRPAMRGLIPEDQEVDGGGDADGDLFSVMGSVAPPGAFDTCSRMSLRMAGSRVGSVRRSAVTRHAAHFYGRQHPDTACFLFMAVDVLEPVIEPGVDYFSEEPTKFLPVDIKPVATGRGPFKMLGGKGGRQLGAVPDPRAVHRAIQEEEEEDEMGMGLDDEWDLHSDMDSVASGFPASSASVGSRMGAHGLPPHLAHLGQVDWAAGSNAVFHVMANPLIRMRRLRVVLEQVGPLAGPMLLESCLRVRASSYVSLSKREYTGDISDHTMCATDLEAVKVARSACKRRIEVTLNLPTSQVLCEKSVRGDRVVLALEVAAFLDGAAQPVVVQRNVVMKVLHPERKQTVLYRMRKTLREPLSDRLHRVGSYYAVKAAKGPHLHETAADFVQFKLAAREQLLRRMVRARALQEGGEARPDLPDCAAWRAALAAATATTKAAGAGAGAEEGATSKPLEVDVDATPGRHGDIGAALAGTMLLNVAERKAVARALFGVELRAPGATSPGKHGNHGHEGGAYGRLVAPGAQVKRGADGVYRVEAIPSSEQSAAGGGLMAARVVTYEYPLRGTGQQMCRERERCWDALSRLWTVEVPDFPTTREGFLNLRTGLLGVQSTRMWFVWRRPFLFAYKGQVGGAHGQQAPVDVVNVSDCRVALGKDELDFEIQGARKTWSLQASCEEDLTSWILALGQPVPGVTDGCGNLLLTGPGMGMGMGMGGASVAGGGGVPLLCYGGPAGDASVSGNMSVRSYRSYATQAPSRMSYRF